jgi:hypothetical protein
MAVTNWQYAEEFQNEAPHTFNALQKLVMAMASYQKNRGKKTFFGKDKGLSSYKNFEEKLRDTLLTMVLDNIVSRTSSANDFREALIECINLFETTFPNWQDAYYFASEFLTDQHEVATKRIQQLITI